MLGGQDAAEREILETLHSGKVPHAWILGGPSGIGKATLAYRFARTVLKYPNPADQHNLASLDVDQDDPVARQIEAQSHPDLMILRRPYDEKSKRLKTQLPVDEIRRLNGFFSHHSSYGGWRVAIIDCADDMNRSAENVLLKILEEPPPCALILLIAHRPAGLLPTIRSRCRKLTLRPLSEDDLGRIAEAHALDLSPEERLATYRLADGSAGAMLSLAQGDGLALYKDLTGLMNELPKLDVGALHSFAGKIGARGAETLFDSTVDLMDRWLQRLIRTAATGETPQDILPGDAAPIAALAHNRPLDSWIEAWDKIRTSCRQGAALNLDRKQLLLTAFFTLRDTAKA
jgi:DNA polymerase-3 subunit delta'